MPVTLTSNVNNATYLITVHTARKHSPEFEKQAEDRTQEGSTPTREAIRETRLPRGLPLKTKHMVDGNDVIRPCIISFGGAKLVSMNTQSKNLDFAWIRNAFFVERKYIFRSNSRGLAPLGPARPDKFINLATLGPSALASRGIIAKQGKCSLTSFVSRAIDTAKGMKMLQLCCYFCVAKRFSVTSGIVISQTFLVI